jgi:hypothetical protein
MSRSSTLRRRIPTALAVAATALAALPASGLAAETFGSRFANSPNNGACSGLMSAPCTYVSFIHPAVGTGDPYAGGAPSDGVITKFRISAYGAGGIGTPATVTFRLAEISRQNEDSAQARTVATGPTVTIAGSGEIEEFPARVSVRKGDHLAIDTADANAVYASSGSDFTYVYAPPLVDGAAVRNSDAVTEELLVGAIYEPDADKDGFGDETQDQCLGNGSDATAPCTPPIGKPKLSGLAVATTATGAKRLAYRLSEAAKVTAKLQKAAKGRKVRGKCRKQTAANGDRKRCTRWVKVRTLKRNGTIGLNEIKLAGRKLAAGRYRVVLTARTTAGVTTKRIGFRVKK